MKNCSNAKHSTDAATSNGTKSVSTEVIFEQSKYCVERLTEINNYYCELWDTMQNEFGKDLFSELFMESFRPLEDNLRKSVFLIGDIVGTRLTMILGDSDLSIKNTD